MSRLLALLLLATMAFATAAYANPKALFDNFHGETAGNADWIIDDTQPIPVPDQSGIGPATARTYWNGAISSWGVDLVKRGYTVHTNTAALTYGNASNTYDLSKYDVLIVPEPNWYFTAAEKTAIFAFILNGGGLVAVSDHGVSDRNSDGIDSPMVWNDLDPTRLFGVHTQVGSTGGATSEPNNNITQTSTNVNAAASDSITRGPVGNVTGLAFHNGTTFVLYPATNPTVRGEVWMNGTAQTSTNNVMAASSVYGNGRFVIVGDSSPADDGSDSGGNSSIYDGWGEAGATDSTLFMNATLWATRRTGVPNDTQAPQIALTSPVGGETWKAGSLHAITWTATDNVGVVSVDLLLSVDGGVNYTTTIATAIANTGTYNWIVPNVPGTQNRVLARARDAANLTGTAVSAANFTVDRWVITASAGTGGTITPSGAVQQAQGTSRAFTIAASPGYHIADVVVDAASVGAVTSYTFSAISANHTIAASFALDGYTLTASATGAGNVARSPALATYPSGTSVEVTAIPDPGYEFSGWSGDTTGTANPFTVLVTRALSYTATFVQSSAGVDDGPAVLALARPTPNPSGTRSTITFSLPRESHASVQVLDAGGRRVASLEGTFGAGRHLWQWEGRLASGTRVRAGLYFVRLSTPDGERIQRLVRLD